MIQNIILGIFFLLTACSKNPKQAESNMEVQVRIALANAALLQLDSVALSIRGPGMTTIAKTFPSTASVLDCGGVPPGEDREFEVQVWEDGVVIQQGSLLADITSGETNTLTIPLSSTRGFLKLEVPLGLQNPLGITQGYLILENESIRDTLVLQGSLPTKFFLSGPLPLDQEYRITVRLLDVHSTVLLEALDTIGLESISPRMTIVMQSLIANVKLDLQLQSIPEIYAQALMPGAVLRKPSALNDLLILELLPNPRTNGNDYEYVEIYNATLDTLVLDSCRIAKDRATTGVTTAQSLQGLVIPPGSFRILGRDSIPFRDFDVGEFSLSNTAQSVVIHCGDLLVDSIAYRSASDSTNPFPVMVGKSIQVPMERYLQRMTGSSWCPGSTLMTASHGVTLAGSPGLDAHCE